MRAPRYGPARSFRAPRFVVRGRGLEPHVCPAREFSRRGFEIQDREPFDDARGFYLDGLPGFSTFGEAHIYLPAAREEVAVPLLLRPLLQFFAPARVLIDDRVARDLIGEMRLVVLGVEREPELEDSEEDHEQDRQDKCELRERLAPFVGSASTQRACKASQRLASRLPLLLQLAAGYADVGIRVHVYLGVVCVGLLFLFLGFAVRLLQIGTTPLTAAARHSGWCGAGGAQEVANGLRLCRRVLPASPRCCRRGVPGRRSRRSRPGPG